MARKPKEPTGRSDKEAGSDFKFVGGTMPDLSMSWAAEDAGAVGESDQDVPVGGCHSAGRGLLASPEQIEDALRNLRSYLSTCGGGAGEGRRRALLEAWIAVQPCLPEGEVEDLRRAFEEAMVPQTGIPSPSKGSAAQGGGYPPCR